MLGISLSMVMMTLRGDRNPSEKALFRLEEAERNAFDQKSRAEQLVENLIGHRDVIDQFLGKKNPKTRAELIVSYVDLKTSRNLPAKVPLLSPTEENCSKLRSLLAETLDTRVIALACLPKEVRLFSTSLKTKVDLDLQTLPWTL